MIRQEGAQLQFFVVLAGLLVAGFLTITRKMRERRRQASMLRLSRVMGGPIPPLNLTITPDPHPDPWCEGKAREFEAIGFVRMGAFCHGPGTARCISLASEDGTVLANASVGTLDGRVTVVCALSAEGDVIEVTDIPDPQKGVHPPWVRVKFLPHGSAAELVAALGTMRISGEALRFTQENYIGLYSAEDRRQGEWQLINGPLRPWMIEGLERMTGMTAEPEAAALLRSAHPGVYPRD